jgi:DNA-binding NarL/FixJ family response regulator
MNTFEPCTLPVKTMRLFIIDSSQALTENLLRVLDELPGLEILGDAQTLAEAVPAIRLLKPDVVMMEVSQLGHSGRDLVSAVTREENAPFVMVLDGNEPGFEAGPDILLYKASSLQNAVAILRNLLLYFQEAHEGLPAGPGTTIH